MQFGFSIMNIHFCHGAGELNACQLSGVSISIQPECLLVLIEIRFFQNLTPPMYSLGIIQMTVQSMAPTRSLALAIGAINCMIKMIASPLMT